MNVLFLNAGRRCELMDAFRAALNAGPGGSIYATDIVDHAPALAKADGYRLMPHSSDESFPQALSAYCKEMAIDLVVPTIDPDLMNLNRWRPVIEENCPAMRLLVPSPQCIAYCNDKRLTKEQFRKAGALVPDDRLPDDPAPDYPLFVKPAEGSASEDIYRLDTPEDLAHYYPLVREPILEPFIPGPEVTVDVLCDFSGKALIAVPRKRLAVRGGEVCRGIIERDPDLEAQAMKLAEAFGCSGPVTVQFRVPNPGEFYAMEINARMGGGLPLAIAAGANWPEWILDLCLGKSPKIHDYQDGLLMSRYDSSVFIPTQPIATPSTWDPTCLKTIIIDMDDTLYPERDFVFAGYRAVAKRVFADWGVDVESALRSNFNAGRRRDVFGCALRFVGLTPSEAYLKELVDMYRNNGESLKSYVDSALLEEFKARGYTLGLVTDGWFAVQQAKVKALGIAHLFDSIVYTDSLGGRDFWKPSPAGLIRCLEDLNAAASTAVYVADNPTKDFQAAQAADMMSIRMRRPGTEHYEKMNPPGFQPAATITGFHELKVLLRLS